MKKKKIIPALIILLLIPVVSFAAAYRRAAGESYHCYNFNELVALTSDGFSYAAYDEHGIPEILKLAPSGEAAGIYAGVRPPWESNMEIEYISGLFNCEETVFSVETHYDSVTGRILHQEIYKLDEKLGRSPFFTYHGDDSPRISHLTADSGMLFITLLDNNGQTAFVDTFDLTGGAPSEPTESLQFASPFDDKFYAALYVNGSLYASTMSGEVLRCSGGVTVNILNSPARDYIPYGIIEAFGTDENGVFFYDASDGFAYNIDASGRLARQDNPVGKRGEHTYALAGAGAYRLALITKKEADVMRISFDGKVTAEFAQLQLSPVLTAKKSLPYALFYALASACAILLIFAIVKAIERSQRLLTKFLFIVTPLTLLAFAGFGFSQYIQLKNLLLSNRDLLSRHYNELVADSFSSGELHFIESPQAYKSDGYAQLQERLRIDSSEGADGIPVRNDIFVARGGAALTGISFDYPCLLPAEDLFAADVLALFKECEKSGLPATGVCKNRGGSLSTTVGPIKDEGGQLAGYVMTSISQNDIAALLDANSKSFATLALAIILPLLALLTLIFRLALRPVGNLRNAMQQVLAGNYEVRLNSVTRDEFSGINLAFNKMCSDLKTHMYKLERISDSYYRFVPRNILPILEKKSILDVNYGDSKRFSACCCALCVHNLSELQAAGTDEDFLKYMGAVGSVIKNSLERCGGVLMSSEMDLLSLLAMFPSSESSPADSFSAENCMSFADGMRQFCSMGSSKFGGISPKIAMVLHRADMLYGITGVDDAAFPILLSDGVDFIMHVVQLFENMRTPIVLTQDILPGLADMPVTEIGWRETPSGEECKLYIVQEGKTAAHENFSKGLNCFYNKDFYNARALFSSIWRDEPSNGVAQWYALAADKYLSYPQQFTSSQLFGTDVYQIDF